MLLEELKQITPVNGVITISEVDQQLEKMFFQINKIENRLYPDEEVKVLPFASKFNPHKNEWNSRVRTFLRFKEYLSKKKNGLNILDLGCGNGWFASKILSEQNHNFYCVDINLNQLQQGARLFTSSNIKFIYADLFSIKFPRSAFNLIILNSSIQYFSDLKGLIRELLYLLPSYGEIHILDSPFYNDEEGDLIKNKIIGNYQLQGFPQMKEKIFFHTYKSLDKFNCRFMYDPRNLVNKFLNIAFSKDSSYPWIIIRK